MDARHMVDDTPHASPRSIGIFTTDAQLVVQSWDAWLERHAGIPAHVAIGMALTTLIPDLTSRRLLVRFKQVLEHGTVAVLSPAFHHYLVRCFPEKPSMHFDTMQQRVTIAPLRIEDRIVGTIVTVEDVTARLEHERDLAEQLHNPDEPVRLRATQTLADAAEYEAAPLTGVLGDTEWRIRRAAVAGLAKRADQDAVANVLRSMRDEHQDLALLNSALQVLALTDVDVVEALVTYLQDQDTDLRIYAALALADQRDPRTIAALIAALDDPDQNVRFQAIEGLGRLRAPEASEPLVAIATSGDFFLAFAAVDALRAIGDPRVVPHLVPLLAQDMLKAPVAEALGGLGDVSSVPALMGLLNTDNAPVTAVTQALATLHEKHERLYGSGNQITDQVKQLITPSTIQRLLAAIDSASQDELRPLVIMLGWFEGSAVQQVLARLLGQPTVRSDVIEALVRFGARVTDVLTEQLAAEDTETRAAAVIALGRIGDAAAVPALLQVLENDPELQVVAADALAKIGDHRAFEPLLQRLGDTDVAVRQAAISALNSLGHPDLEARVAPLVLDPDPLIRESALRIAGYFGYASCVEAILGSVEDDDERVRTAAVEALPYLDDPRCLPLLQHVLQHDAPSVRAAAARALGQMDVPMSVHSLVGALQDSHPWVRYFAARSLGQHANVATLPDLVRLLKTDSAGQVRIAATEALGLIGGEQAVQELAPLVTALDPDHAKAALHALGQTKHPAALPPLLDALRSSDALFRTAAMGALATHGGDGVAQALQWVAAADQDRNIQQVAIEALGRVRTFGATGALIELLLNPDHRAAVCSVLVGKGASAVSDLEHGLQHPHPAIRAIVVEILGQIKSGEATNLVVAMLNDPDPVVRRASVTVLGRQGYQPIVRKLAELARADPDEDVRRAAQALLER